MKKKKNITGWTFLLLFCIPFVGVGTGMGYAVASSLVKWQAMKSWVEVPAFIQQTNLDSKRDSESTSYKVTATYTYTYNDKSYTGNKVSMHSGTDNIGSFQKKTYAELSKYKKSGEPFRCYVNPSNPTESILFRAPRWEKLGFYMIFVLVFGGIGFGLLFNGIKTTDIKRRENNLISQYPNEPWLWVSSWAEGIIHSQSKNKLKLSLFFALTFGLVSILILKVIPDELQKGNKPILIALIFPITALGLVIWMIRNIVTWRKFGDSTFVMETRPGVIGGPLKGKIHTKVNIKPEDGFYLTLSCINRVKRDEDFTEYVRWQDECNIAHEMYEYDPSLSVIPVLFHIPYDSQETNSDNSNNIILWRLEIKAKVPGVDYAATFEVPVFKTPESSEDFVLDKSSIVAYESPYNLEAALTAEGIRIDLLLAGEKRYIFPCARNKKVTLSLFLFLLIWAGSILLVLKLKAPILFPIVFGLVEIFLIYIFLDMLLFHSQVEICNSSISIEKGLFSLGKKQTLNFSDIESFKLKSCMSSGNKLYYDLNLITKGGRKHVIAKNLPSRHMAENLMQEMEKNLLT